MATMAEEIANVLDRLDNFVNTSDLETLANLVNSPKFTSLISNIHQKVPEATKSLVSKVLDKAGQPESHEASGLEQSVRKPRKAARKDSTYRAPWAAIISKDGSQSKDDHAPLTRQSSRLRDPNPSKGNKDSSSCSDGSLTKDSNAQAAQSAAQPQPLASPNTPIRKIRTATPSTEEVPRNVVDVRVSADKIFFSPAELIPRTAVVDGAIRSIQLLERYPRGNPMYIYQQILRKISSDETFYSYGSSNMLHLSTWMGILETTEAQSRKVSVFGLLELIGFHEWFVALVKHNQNTQNSPKGKRLGNKVAKTFTLDKLLEPCGDLQRIKKEKLDDLRASINSKLHRGEKLTTLVKQLGLGILFSPDIWDYVKMPKDEFGRLIESIQGNSWLTKLLKIFGEQLMLLVNTGKTDLGLLLSRIRTEELLPETKCADITAELPVEAAKLLDGSLSSAIDQLKDRIRELLGKEFTDADEITIGGKDYPCRMFRQLYAGDWFGTELIDAYLTMSDKLPFVRFSFCIQLHHGTKRLTAPFQALGKRVNEWRSKANGQHLAYLSPLIHNGNHFSLLEINEIERRIFHYDSLASQNSTISAAKPSELHQALLKEFEYLKFDYIEAPTPQQKDESSCGPMVVRNARRRMNGVDVGHWDDTLDPERLRMEVVELFNSSISNYTVRKRLKRSGTPYGLVEDCGSQRRVSSRLTLRRSA